MISFSFSDSDEDWMKIQVKYAIISLLVLQISHLHYSIYVSLKTPTKKVHLHILIYKKAIN